MVMKRNLLKISPYIASTIAAFLFYLIGLNLGSENVKNLFINIASTFLAIPLIYLFYQTARNFSEKQLNKEILDYAKLQVDTEILSLIRLLHKIVHPLTIGITFEKINELLSLKSEDIMEILSENEYLGFQIFKKLKVNEENLHEILKNPYMLERLKNEQIISIISIIKGIRSLTNIQNEAKLYIKTSEKNRSYKILKGTDSNKNNTNFPDRYLLLKNLGNDKVQVVDFGDFPLYNIDNLLCNFKVNENFLRIYSQIITDLIKELNNWATSTGSEFIIDTEMFRINYKH